MNGNNNQELPPANWQFKTEDNEQVQPSGPNVEQTVRQNTDEIALTTTPPTTTAAYKTLRWNAPDMAAHTQKPNSWYVMLAVGTIVLAALIYVVTRDNISAGTVVLAAVFYVIFGVRKPKSLQYQLDFKGIVIGQRHYRYDQFRSFSVVDEAVATSIALTPLKRFMPVLAVHYGPEMESHVISALSDHLPLEPYQRDAMDIIIQKLRL